jgi:hypothetical protein
MSTTEDQPETTTVALPETAPGGAPGTGPDTVERSSIERSSVERSSVDRFMLRLLRLPEGQTSTKAEARSAFQKSLAISTCRCLLMYIVFPFVLPAVGIARGVGPIIGVAIGVLAIVSITYSIRRFWRADHPQRWAYTIFGTTIICFLLFLAVKDISTVA